MQKPLKPVRRPPPPGKSPKNQIHQRQETYSLLCGRRVVRPPSQDTPPDAET
jgi:hypothetical protein